MVYNQVCKWRVGFGVFGARGCQPFYHPSPIQWPKPCSSFLYRLPLAEGPRSLLPEGWFIDMCVFGGFGGGTAARGTNEGGEECNTPECHIY